MNMYTRMSEKGQVVVPKALRDLKGWPAGTDLEVLDSGDGIFLRPRAEAKKGLTVGEAAARLRLIYQHKGPPVAIEDLGWTADGDDAPI